MMSILKIKRTKHKILNNSHGQSSKPKLPLPHYFPSLRGREAVKKFTGGRQEVSCCPGDG
jgi:hypothetical protein